MNLLLLFSLVVLLFSSVNFFFNSKTRILELFTTVPTHIYILFLLGFALLGIIQKNYIAVYDFLFSVLISLNFLDITLFKKQTALQTGNTVKILDWNTLFFYPSNYSEIANKINSFNADILCLQELWTGSDNKIISQEPILEKGVKITGVIDKSQIQRLFSEYKYVEQYHDRVVISKYPVKRVSEKRFELFGYCISEINIDNTILYLFNVHMPFRYNATFGYDLKKQAFDSLNEDLNKYLEKNANNVIVTGDFNATKSSNFINKLYSQMNECVSENISGIHLTWHSKLPFWRLDFMFYSGKNINCFQTKYLKSEKFSDHRGIISDFEIA